MPTVTGMSAPEATRLVTEEYRLKVLRCEPTSFGYRFLTDHGPRLGLLVRRRPEAVELLVSVYEHLNAAGWTRLPQLVRTSAGARFLPLAPKLGLVLTTTLQGRPAPSVGSADPAGLGQLLAEFHRRTADLAPPPSETRPAASQTAGLERWLSLIAERSADLATYELVARHRLNPGLFDAVFVSAAPGLRFAADEAVARLRSASVPACDLAPVVCTGEFTWSDLVWLTSDSSSPHRPGFATLRNSLLDTRPSNLARLLGLLGRDTRWRLEPLRAAVSAFEGETQLSKGEREFLQAWLTFPYDAWQIADRYFRNKLDIPHREAVQFLTAVTRDEPARQACVRALAAMR